MSHKHEWQIYGGDQVGPDIFTRRIASCDCGAKAYISMGQLILWEDEGLPTGYVDEKLKTQLTQPFE